MTLTQVQSNQLQRKRSTVAKILARRRIIEGVMRNKLLALLTFLDFVKKSLRLHPQRQDGRNIHGVLNPTLVSSHLNHCQNHNLGRSKRCYFVNIGMSYAWRHAAPFSLIIVLNYALRQSLKDHEKLVFTITYGFESE